MTDSLLKCTLKKSLHTTERILVYVSYVIVAIAALTATYYGAIYGLLPLFITLVDRVVKPTADVLLGILVSIPLWVYGLAAIPVAIIGYSFLWCIARDLTEADWESETAKDLAIDIAIAIAFAIVINIAFAFAIALALAIAIAFAIAITIAIVIDIAIAITIAIDSKIMRFPGAVWHHYMQAHP